MRWFGCVCYKIWLFILCILVVRPSTKICWQCSPQGGAEKLIHTKCSLTCMDCIHEQSNFVELLVWHQTTLSNVFWENSSHRSIIPSFYNTGRMLRLLGGQGTRHKTQSEKRYAIKWLNTCCILCGIHPNLVDSQRRSWLRQWNSGGGSKISITGSLEFISELEKLNLNKIEFFQYINGSEMGKCAVCCKLTWLGHVMAQKNSRDLHTNFKVIFGPIPAHLYFFLCTWTWVSPK